LAKKQNKKQKTSPTKKSKKVLKPSKNLTPEEKKLKKQYLRYTLFVIMFSLILFAMTDQSWFASISSKINILYAKISSFIINIFGEDTYVINDHIGSKEFSMSLRKGCDALAPIILYSTAILAFPVKFSTKWKSIFIGIALLSILNVIRIATLYIIGSYASETIFDLMHETVWPVFFIIFTLFLFLRWLNTLMTKKPNATE